MWEKILESAVANGVWAVLFCSLFIFELKDSRNREVKYQQTIERLSKSLQTLEVAQGDINSIRDNMRQLLERKIILRKETAC